MKIGIVQFPGSNCERETKLAVRRLGFEPIDCFWHATPQQIKCLDGFIIVGGFSYEDRVRSGMIAARDPIMQELRIEADKGKPVLGICNGAQILVESGLVPPMALTTNQRLEKGKHLGIGFYNEWVYVKSNRSNEVIHLPVAHAEGRFLIDPAIYESLQCTPAIFYYYCDKYGAIIPEFPSNPNGSMYNLAAVSNSEGNIMAIMPHPERTPAGDIILKEFFQPFIIKNTASRPALSQTDHFKQLPSLEFKPYSIAASALHYWVALLLDDNEAITLENTLQQSEVTIKIKKLIHWQIAEVTPEEETIIFNSDELFNRQKEKPIDVSAFQDKLVYLVRQKQDEVAAAKQVRLSKMLDHEVALTREVVWIVDYLPGEKAAVKAFFEQQYLLGNPLSHEGFIL